MQILLIVLGGLCVVLMGVLLNKLFKVKVWIEARQKKNQPLVCTSYLEKGGEGEAGEVHRAGAFGKPAIAIVKVDEKSTLNRGYVDVLMTDMNDDAEKPHYRRTGYVSFDQDTKVDQYGYIYKQIKGKKEKEVVGYLARPSKPNEPTIYGERSWKTLWLKCVLNAYAGLPDMADEEASDTPKPATKPAQPVEHLCINNPKKKDPSPEVLPTEEERQDAVLETIQETTPDITSEATSKIVPELMEVPVLEEPIVDEIPAEKTHEEDVQKEDAQVTESEPQPEPELEPEPTPEPEPEPAPEPEPVDPFAALSAEEKTRLDKVRDTNKALIDAFLNRMVKVDGGTFTMGADPKPNDTKDADGKERGMVENNESPKHEVTLSTYYIASTPVTQELWTTVMGSNPSDCKDKPTYPVAPVNWNECQDFVLRLSYIAGVQFTLPTEAQWEYAARGGKKSKGYAFAGSNTFSEVGWSDHKHEVGTKKPNELGLYDMSGLVREWCSDYFAHYTEEAQTDPTGPQEGAPEIIKSQDGVDFRAVRSPSGNETVTNRKGEVPELDKDFKSYGLRVVAKEMPERQKEEQAVKPLEKPAPKKPMAVCSYWGFHNSKRDILPAEARAGAFALLQRYAPRQKQAEYASEQPYGWKDTALLSSFIYTVIFILVYMVNSGIFQMPLLGKSLLSTLVFVGYYMVLWAIVRCIKIDSIENANSFQPILDLFNKNLHLKWVNWSIVICCAVASLFTLFYYDYDFLPLLIVIAFGVLVNMTLPDANRRWKVQASFLEDTDTEEDDDDQAEPQNPQGDISRSYEWTLDETYDANRSVPGSLTLYFTAAEIRDVRHLNPFFDQRKDHSDKENILYMFRFLKKYKKTFLARTNYVAYTINKIAEKNSFSPMDKLQYTLDFVQEPNIAFVQTSEDKSINFYDDYIRYPDETLYDKCGDSTSKALLAAMLFHVMGHNVLYLISRKHKHAAVAVEVRLSELKEGWYGDADKINEITIKYEDKYYIFCETTGDNFALGAQVSGMSLDEFDEKIYLPFREDDDECDNANDEDEDVFESRIFMWDLDSFYGNQLKGNLPIEMSSTMIEELRSRNPFNTYGQDGNTYIQNVQAMFQYLKANPDKMAGVRQVTDYIRQTTKNAGIPELDMLQFALDFAQEPNIKYMIDEQSASIEFAKEYMRFPEEVMFDKEGDCDCKSSLTAALFLNLGYKVLFMISEKLKHAAIGVECKDHSWITQINPANPDDVVLDHNGVLYLYCETTGDGYHIGQIKENESIKDFETILELSL